MEMCLFLVLHGWMDWLMSTLDKSAQAPGPAADV